jgi:peptidoglycan/xylan/chitin deacetylase (PgdA/CDA1 family)
VTAVLLYHDVADAAARETVGFPGPLAARYKLEPHVFRAHLEAIASAGVRVGLLEDSPRPDVALTFDDTGASAPVVASALEAHGWRGYFFAPTARIGTPGFVDGGALRELVQRGHRVGSHSHTHPTYMGKLSRGELDEEWLRSRDVLRSVLGAEPEAASVPGGFLSKGVIHSAAESGFGLLMTSEPTARVKDVRGMTVVGRYAISSSTPPPRAAAYARGDLAPRARLWLEWQAKTTAKRVSPRAYQLVRRVRTRL